MDSEKKHSFSQLPSNIWWSLRKKLIQTPSLTVNDGYFVATLNLKKSATRVYLSDLRNIGLIGEDGKPTKLAQRWRDDDQYPEVCKELREKLYPLELLSAAPPPTPDRDTVVRWFMHVAGLGEGAAKNKSAFYLLLCDGDPSKQNSETGRSVKKPKSAQAPSRHGATNTGTAKRKSGDDIADSSNAGASVNPRLQLNIQIHVGADATIDQIDAIFASMAKHLNVSKT